MEGVLKEASCTAGSGTKSQFAVLLQFFGQKSPRFDTGTEFKLYHDEVLNFVAEQRATAQMRRSGMEHRPLR
jgi:hypothetical protein